MKTLGSIPTIIRNDARLYEGDLIAYFRITLKHAQNLQLPYHNFRHVFHVLYLCYKACEWYHEDIKERSARNLLIGVLFHDFNHSGRLGNDDLNIEMAIRSLRQHVLPEDREHLPSIEAIIRATEFPYKVSTENLSLPEKIIRDADLSQVLSVAWIQQVIFGLAAEWDKKPIEILSIQGPFMRGLKFNTGWAQTMFPQEEIDAKIQEAKELLDLLNGGTPTS